MSFMLTGERVTLRDFTHDDWRAVHAYSTRAEVYRFQPWGPNTPEQTREFVDGVIAQAQRQPRIEYNLAMALAATGEVIGAGSLGIRSREFGQGEIGYVVRSDYWGRGYGTEAARLLLEFGFTTLGLHRIFATCDPRNLASARVLEKIGMRYEGRLRDTMLIRDGWRDSLIYSLLEHEWQP